MLGNSDSYKVVFTNRSRRKINSAMLQKYEITFNDNKCNVNLEDKNVYLEIGFGNGEHLYEQITSNNGPDNVFIGCDPFTDGAVSLAKKLYKNEITSNVYIYHGAVGVLLDQLPSDFLSKVFILFPDPWPKSKHKKRRIISENFLLNLYGALNKTGVVRFATDHEDYIMEVKDTLSKSTKWKFTDIVEYKDEWPKTKFQQKAVNKCLAIEFSKNIV